MFVSKALYERILDDLSKARADFQQSTDLFGKLHTELSAERGRREILSRQAAVQESFVEFLCARVNQLETERVVLLRHLTTIELPTPAVRLRPAGSGEPGDDAAAMAGVSMFDDDPSHAPKGWHADGTVNYGTDDTK
jgi:hypothetical protein